MKLQHIFNILFLFSLALNASCAKSSEAAIDQEVSFGLYILKQRWGDLKLGYEPDPAQSILGNLNINDSLYVIQMEHIETYDWKTQTIILTKEATVELSAALAYPEQNNDEGVQKLKELQTKLGYGNALESQLYSHAFVVRSKGEMKYGGIFLDAISQMAIDYPVIRVTVVDGQAHLALLPVHIPFVMIDPVDGVGSIREAQVVPEAKSDVEQLDFFTKWYITTATSATANHFRAIIRDEAIKNIFLLAGKLK